MKGLFLVAKIAGERVAIPSNEVESVVRVSNYVSVPGVSPVIAGLFALRSRVLTLIDTQYHISGKHGSIDNGAFCVVTEIDGHPYGLIVDTVEDVVTVHENTLANIGFANGKWRSLCRGMITHDHKLLLLLDTYALIDVKNIAA